MSDEKTFPVVEIFGPTIQGEGPDVGMISHFIRLGGCDYRCSWCDSPHAVLPELVQQHAERLTVPEIVERIPKGSNVVLTGGNPAMFDLGDLVIALRTVRGCRIVVETQGTVNPHKWLASVDRVVISPKPPSSGMSYSAPHLVNFLEGVVFWPWGLQQGARAAVKIVLMTLEDLDWAHKLVWELPTSLLPKIGPELYFSLGTSPETSAGARADFFVPEITARQWPMPVRLLPQVHVLLWGDELGR